MTTTLQPPKYPAGEFQRLASVGASEKQDLARRLRAAPQRLRKLTSGLTPDQLNTKYRNWTVRQIVHHLADSHINALVRFKLALTEDVPTIKPYDESKWSAVVDATEGPIEPSLAILDGLHARWAYLVEQLDLGELGREFHHPEMGRHLSLAEALEMYVWHADHHTGQIQWMRDHSVI
jgi:hypothetical protein